MKYFKRAGGSERRQALPAPSPLRLPWVAVVGHSPTLRSRVCKARLQTTAWGEASWSQVEWASLVDTAWRGRSLTGTGGLPGRIPSAPSSPGPHSRWPGCALLSRLRSPHTDRCLLTWWPLPSASGHLRDPNDQHYNDGEKGIFPGPPKSCARTPQRQRRRGSRGPLSGPCLGGFVGVRGALGMRAIPLSP